MLSLALGLHELRLDNSPHACGDHEDGFDVLLGQASDNLDLCWRYLITTNLSENLWTWAWITDICIALFLIPFLDLNSCNASTSWQAQIAALAGTKEAITLFSSAKYLQVPTEQTDFAPLFGGKQAEFSTATVSVDAGQPQVWFLPSKAINLNIKNILMYSVVGEIQIVSRVLTWIQGILILMTGWTRRYAWALSVFLGDKSRVLA